MNKSVKQEPPKLTVLMLHNVPRESKQRFKEYCAHRGVTMQDAMLRLMNGCCNEWFDPFDIPPARHHA
jgi:hypothetical protein